MKIRIAKKEDFEQYLELNRKSLREYSKISLQKIPINNKKIKKEFDFIFKNQRRFMLVSEENRIITGYLIWILLTDTFQKTGYVDDLFIKKEFRRYYFWYKRRPPSFCQHHQIYKSNPSV